MPIGGPANDTEIRPRLDGPPPLPDKVGRKPSLLDAKPGLGGDSGNPQIMALQGMQMFEKGALALGQGFPALQAPLSQMIAFVRQAVPQAMAGGNPQQAPAAAPPQGGPPPMAAPPPPGGGMAPPGAGM